MEQEVIIYMWEFPSSFGYMIRTDDDGWRPDKQPWLYQPREENHPWWEKTY